MNPRWPHEFRAQPAATIASGNGELNPMDRDQVQAAFQGTLSAVPQAKAVIYVGTDLQSARASRGEEPLLEVIETGISIVAMGGHDLHHGRG